jgi:UDP-4-amino-4,6-dideoxy-N-acetyl-beta-L-altrosamine transaminase
LKDSYIPYGRQSIDDADVKSVIEVLRSDFLTQGPTVPTFERALSDACGASHAVAVNSGTSALHLACRALDLGPGDWLWTSPNTFVASANCARYCGAQVDFVDINPRTYNLSVEALAVKLGQAESGGRLPRVVVPVHFAGQPCDMEGIGRLSERYGFRILVDATHAIGARYNGRSVGCDEHGDITVFSFHPVKMITSAEGGMAVTGNAMLAERMRRLRSHGITKDPAAMTRPAEGPWSYEQVELGFNYRLTDLAAALGLSQLARLEAFVSRREALAARYDRELAGLPITRPWQDPRNRSSWHLYVIQIESGSAPIGRGELFRNMRDAGIGVNVHFTPVHTQPYYRNMGFAPGDFPVAEGYYENALTLPLYPALTEKEQDRVIQTLRRCLQ